MKHIKTESASDFGVITLFFISEMVKPKCAINHCNPSLICVEPKSAALHQSVKWTRMWSQDITV